MACHQCPHSKGIHNSSCPPPCSKGEKKNMTLTLRECDQEREKKNDQLLKT